tara:strand:+ start:626 stop:748 length:123 start_codon:yes stop_codon:yes gene_type:complete
MATKEEFRRRLALKRLEEAKGKKTPKKEKAPKVSETESTE